MISRAVKRLILDLSIRHLLLRGNTHLAAAITAGDITDMAEASTKKHDTTMMHAAILFLNPTSDHYFFISKKIILIGTLPEFFMMWLVKMGPAATGAGMPANGLMGTGCGSSILPFG